MTISKDTGLDARPLEEIKAEFERRREAEEAGDMMVALARTRDRAHNASRAMAFLFTQMRAGCVDTVPTNLGCWTANTSGIEAVLDLVSEALRMGDEADCQALDRLERLLSSRVTPPDRPEATNADQ